MRLSATVPGVPGLQLPEVWMLRMVDRKRRGMVIAAALMESLEPRVLFSFTLDALSSFAGLKSGIQPAGLVMDGAGNLYGTTVRGGTKGYGIIFSIPASTGTLTTLANFTGLNGISPSGSLVLDSGGTLYGTTVGGGSSNLGTVFSFITGSTASTITTLAVFTGANGAFPFNGLVADGAGNLFGTTLGGKAKGKLSTLFEVASGSGAITTLATFKFTDQPLGQVVVDSSGNIFGTTFKGGSKSLGSLYTYPTGSTASTVTTLASFTTTSGGLFPRGGLLIDSGGNLIGTTLDGGSHNAGTIFKFDPNATLSTVTTLANFKGSDGSRPVGTMILDGDGNLFGVTAAGGTKNRGTVFEFPAGTTTSTVTSLFSFTGNSTGLNPTGPLVLNGDGHLFGTTYLGGTANRGSVFEIEPGVGAPPVTATLRAGGVSGGLLQIVQQPVVLSGGKVSLTVKLVGGDSPVTASIASGPAGATIAGTLVVKTVNGVANFGGIMLSTQGIYSLRLTSGNLEMVTDRFAV